MKDVHKKLNDFFQGSRRKLIICYEENREPEGNNMEEAIVIEDSPPHTVDSGVDHTVNLCSSDEEMLDERAFQDVTISDSDSSEPSSRVATESADCIVISSSDEDMPSTSKKTRLLLRQTSPANTRDDSSSSDEAPERIFRPGAIIAPSGLETLKSRKRQLEETPVREERPNFRSFRSKKKLDLSTKNMKEKINPRIRRAKEEDDLCAAKPKTESNLLMEEIAEAEKREALRKYARMTDDQLVKIGTKFGLGSSTNALRTKELREQYIEHLSRIEAYKKTFHK